MNSINAYSKPFKNEELDRQLEFGFKNYSDKILGCFLYDYLLDDCWVDELQNLQKKNIKPNEEFICEFCDKQLVSKQSKNNHLKTSYCKNMYEKELKIKEYEQQIKDKDDEINKLRNQIKDIENKHLKSELENMKENMKEMKNLYSIIILKKYR